MKKTFFIFKSIYCGCVVLTAIILTGCTTTDYHAALLYKKDQKGALSNSKEFSYQRPTVQPDSQLFFNGNVIQVPRGRLAQFGLKELKVGWLADRDRSHQSFPTTRVLPERTLWLVVQIEGFKTDDFLRTSSKRSFLASAVKQNQNSEGYLALDTAESNFALQTSDWQYEVTFTLYSVDNFKLKQVLGYAVKDNKGLLVTGYDALKQMGGSTYSFIADPILRSAKHQLGEEFLFERLLLTANAVTEFKGMVYLVGQSGTTSLPETATYALADLSDVPGMENLKSLEKYFQVFADNQGGAAFLPFRNPDYRAAYSNTLNAVNMAVSDSLLRDGAANVLRFDLSVTEDKNKAQAGQVEQLNPLLTDFSTKQADIRLIVDNYLKSAEQSKKTLDQLRANATVVLDKIEAADMSQLAAAAQYKMQIQKPESNDLTGKAAAKSAVISALNLPDKSDDKKIESAVDETLHSAGIEYVPTEKNLTFPTQNPGTVSVGSRSSTAPTPALIQSQLMSLRDTIETINNKVDGYRRKILALNNAQTLQNVKLTLEQIQAIKIQDELKQSIPSTIDPQVGKLIRPSLEALYKTPLSNISAQLEEQYGELGKIQSQIDAIKQQGGTGDGTKVTIF